MLKTFGSDIYDFLLLRSPEMKAQRQYIEASGVSMNLTVLQRIKRKLLLHWTEDVDVGGRYSRQGSI